MGHKVHADVYDKDDLLLHSIRAYACDGDVKPVRNPTGVKWKRYIEIDKCIFTKEEIIKWCEFMCECGFECSFDEEVVSFPLSYSDYVDGKYVSVNYTANCYSIIVLREHYKNDAHLFIANTLIRYISYKFNEEYEYENIVKTIFDINIDIDPLEKFILAHYRKDYNSSGIGNHGASYRLSQGKSIKLQKVEEFEIGVGVNVSFDKSSTASYSEIVNLVESKKYQEAYNILKNAK